jgi:hypothetical protein
LGGGQLHVVNVDTAKNIKVQDYLGSTSNQDDKAKEDEEKRK